MKFILSLLSLLFAVAFNGTVGATVASMLDFNPLMGAGVANGVSMLTGIFPAGVLRSGLLTEVWTGYLNKAFKTSAESVGWYARVKNFSQYVNNSVIHLVNVGVKPDVLINNTTYPIGISTVADADKAVSLDKLQTKRTVVTDDSLHALSYDKMALDIEQHKDAIMDTIYAKAIHAFAPDENSENAPVVATSGSNYGTRKQITLEDILKIKRAFDAQKVPSSDRILVLCPDHVNDLLSLDQKFREQYSVNTEDGKIARLYGFDIYEYVDCPYFTSAGVKVAYGTAAGSTDTMASVAFAASKCLRADGDLKMYYSEAKTNPETQQNEVNFRRYSIALPMSTECIAAIYSDAAAEEETATAE